jgi:O-succinylbenzoic acid--CoA ligase
MVRSKPQHSTIYLNDLATFLFTSGSSGIPKIACHRFSNHYLNAISVVDRLQLEIGSRWLLSLPLFHVSGIGILFRCFLKGATIVLSDLPFSESIIQHKISHLSLVPTQLSRLLKESLETLEKMKSSLKCILLGGAPIPLATLMEGNDQQLPIYTTYGMTEMTSMITLSEKNPIGHSGQLLSNRELKLEKAEIWVKGETLFQGYWDPDTEKIILPEQSGWFATKDLGQFNQDGNLEITGRKDRQFISGGENIQPEEIEQALCTIPGIRQACVLSINDAEFGERPIAFIDDETRTHTLETIRQALRDRLPSFKHPVHILPYPAEAGIKPTLAILQQHLSQFQKSSLKNQG